MENIQATAIRVRNFRTGMSGVIVGRENWAIPRTFDGERPPWVLFRTDLGHQEPNWVQESELEIDRT